MITILVGPLAILEMPNRGLVFQVGALRSRPPDAAQTRVHDAQRRLGSRAIQELLADYEAWPLDYRADANLQAGLGHGPQPALAARCRDAGAGHLGGPTSRNGSTRRQRTVTQEGRHAHALHR